VAVTYLRRINGSMLASMLAIVTDLLWGWRPRTCVACPPGDGTLAPSELWAYNSNFSTEERVPPGAAWPPHNGGFDATKTTWRTVVKRMPVGVCDDVDPPPFGSVAAAPPPDDLWPTASRAAFSVLGILLALVTGLVASSSRAVWRERRRLYGPWGEEEWEEGAVTADEWERPAAAPPPDAIGGALWDPTAAAAAPSLVVAPPTRGEWRPASGAAAPPSEPTDTLIFDLPLVDADRPQRTNSSVICHWSMQIASSGGTTGEEVLGTSSSLEAAMASGFPAPPLMPEGLAGSVDGPERDIIIGEGAP